MRKMSYLLDRSFPTSVGEAYAIKSDHRNHSKRKSQWTVPPEQEVTTFEGAYSSSWFSRSGEQAWGLHDVNGKPHALGITAGGLPRKERLWLAKFVRNAMPLFWHGYPANYRFNSQDRPPDYVLRDWHRHGYIRKHEISRIRRGRACSLSD